MRILSDSKSNLPGFVPQGTIGTIRETCALDPIERAIWGALADGAEAWIAEVSPGTSPTFWRRLLMIGEARRSQFDALHEVLGAGPSLDAPTAALALKGSGFRGQRGRPWLAREGNLFLTVGFPVDAPAKEVIPALIMLPAVAVADAIRQSGTGRAAPTIKWINDILVDGRKAGGVLTATLCRNGVVEAAVLGIGVNVAHAPAVRATPFVPAAGSLAEAGIDVTLARFTWCVLDKLVQRYEELLSDGPSGLLWAYREASCIVGRRVRVWGESMDERGTPDVWPAPVAAGVVTSIEADLSLKLDGCADAITRGRLAFEETCTGLGL